MRVYSQITKGQFTTKKKKGKENYWDLLHSALWFNLDFCNNSEMKPGLSIMISGLRFSYFFFLQKMYSLFFYSLKKKIANLKTLCQYWGPAQQHCGFLIHEERWWVGYSGKSPAGTSIYVESQVETWSRWGQIKIWMMFSKKQGIILDKASNNFLVSKRENPSWGSLPTTGVKVRTDKI